MHPFTLKYKPVKTNEIIGQEIAIKKLKKFISDYKKQKKKAVLVYGPTGIGKTISAYALANEMDLEILEVNASDIRNKEQIEQKIGSAIGQQSLFFKQKLILIDEIDGLSGTKDRGGLLAITNMLEKSSFPIILTATNPWDYKFNKLRRKTEMVEFLPLNYIEIFNILKKICDDEKIKYEDEVLKGLARRAGNDARSAVNDLQTLTIEAKELTKKGLEELGERNKLDTIINALFKIFKSTDPNVAITAFENVEEKLDQQLLWIDENLPKEYTKPEDLAKAYDKLSKADVFNRRIRRWQHYRFLVYINALITAGIAVSKKERYKHRIQYKPTGRLLKLWWAKQKSMKKKAIAEKIAEKTHSSSKDVIKNSLPYFQLAFKKNKSFRESFSEELNLSKEEVEWLRK
ncbi:MAG TPA: replication factor C large subunit [Candidatus Woesearchaeota archaeon]|jgi:replication factor C large subunit|nr:replication factor C large subunit [Candidatus Woesearchaeota archaeon]HJN56681.1 replication factor C large subunit [Candidatus Woesearchaeota archaeon]|tara:strand:+ start:4914 stop:6122 length:1209 start_codon:yes stop_codon:yes gene_type:complete